MNINDSASLKSRAVQGAVLALVLTVLNFAFFCYSKQANKTWMLLPLTTVPLSGAIGGVIVYYINPFNRTERWLKIFLAVISISIYSLMITAGFILGMSKLIKL
jgi:hypothetical protein